MNIFEKNESFLLKKIENQKLFGKQTISFVCLNVSSHTEQTLNHSENTYAFIHRYVYSSMHLKVKLLMSVIVSKFNKLGFIGTHILKDQFFLSKLMYKSLLYHIPIQSPIILKFCDFEIKSWHIGCEMTQESADLINQ